MLRTAFVGLEVKAPRLAGPAVRVRGKVGLRTRKKNKGKARREEKLKWRNHDLRKKFGRPSSNYTTNSRISINPRQKMCIFLLLPYHLSSTFSHKCHKSFSVVLKALDRGTHA
jgi:hypothetical protein